MRAFLSNLTAVMLVIHAMIGCCHHHWHSEAECAESATFALFVPPCQCGHSCCGRQDQSEQSSSPCDREFECQGLCSYLPTQRTVIEASASGAAIDFAALVPTLLDGRFVAAALPCDRAHTLNHSPPLKLHLLNQILLL
jgi:hypothetical protein